MCIRDSHEHVLVGHPGTQKLYDLIRQNDYYWFSMKNDIRTFIRHCTQCQLVKTNQNPTKVPMVITDTASRPLEKIAMDIVGPLPLTIRGYRFSLTIQDNLTKFIFLKAMPVHTAEQVSSELITFFSLFGLPQMILSDQKEQNFAHKL